MKTVIVPNKAPRDAKNFKGQIPFFDGLRIPYYLSWFMALGMIIPLVSIMVTGGPELLQSMLGKFLITFAIFLMIGGFIFARTQKTYRSRINAFEKGIMVEGKVIDQGRSFVFYSSMRDYTLTVEFEDDQGENRKAYLKSRKPELHQLYPVSSEVKGFWDSYGKCYFFPIEVGVEVEES